MTTMTTGDASLPADAIPSTPDGIRRQALEWQVVLWSGEVTDGERASFRQWLAAAPAHEDAWRKVQSMDHLLADLPGDLGGKILRRPPPRRTVLRTLGWLAGGGLLATAVRETPQWRQAGADYATRSGERREFTLDDGTRLVLNTDTAVDVHFDTRQRRIRLHAGEILVTTAPDPAPGKRPFLVTTAQGELQALGTRFSVRSDAGSARVAVFEGAVEIRPAADPAQAQRLDAGQQTRFDALAVAPSRNADPLAIAWTRGQLIAERLRLADFLAELGRYRSGILRCDPAVADLIVSGVYPLDDTDLVLAALAEALPLRVQYATRYWVTVKPR